MKGGVATIFKKLATEEHRESSSPSLNRGDQIYPAGDSDMSPTTPVTTTITAAQLRPTNYNRLQANRLQPTTNQPTTTDRPTDYNRLQAN